MFPHTNLRVALVHYWFVNHGGGERVVEALGEMFPQADLFALVAEPASLTPNLRKHRLRTSFLQQIPFGRRWYRHLLPLYPFALEQLDLSGYDLVISSESGPAKGVITSARTLHLCYCHSPMRYLWDNYHEYRRGIGVRSFAFAPVAHYLRLWDYASAARVDAFVANSANVANRIRKHYRRDATVIHPPVSLAEDPLREPSGDYYLVVSRLVEYKRIDLAIEACNRLGRKLRIVGTGDRYKALKRAAGSSVEFLGRLEDHEIREQYRNCRAFLFPGEEDFGITPVEAQSHGRPVIAYGCGGVLETVNGIDVWETPDGAATGVFFREQSCDALCGAMLAFERWESRFLAENIRGSVQRFSPLIFKERMMQYVSRNWEEFSLNRAERALSPPPEVMPQ